MTTVHVEPLWTCALVTLCAFLVLMQPTLRYTITGWKAKRKDILDSLNPDARRTYFLMFAGGQDPPKDPDEASTRFEEFYTGLVRPPVLLVPRGFSSDSPALTEIDSSSTVLQRVELACPRLSSPLVVDIRHGSSSRIAR